MIKPFYLHALSDEVVKVQVASSDDVPGLATEAKTTEALVQKLKTLSSELLATNELTQAEPSKF